MITRDLSRALSFRPETGGPTPKQEADGNDSSILASKKHNQPFQVRHPKFASGGLFRMAG